MSKHTKGPWRVVVELRQEDECVCDMLNHAWVIPQAGTKLANWRDDAALIAAAPELLEALEWVIDAYSKPDKQICCSGFECGCMGATEYQQAEHYAREAIAKARGEA